jgi:prepilin-type processing-associated H-X9-DG protein
MYTDDNDQYFPLNQSAPGLKDPRFPIEKLSTNSWVSGNPRFEMTTKGIENGTLFPYLRTVGVYRCPLDDSTVMNQPRVNRNRSYSISAYLAGDNVGLDPRVKLKYDQLIEPRPDSVFVFIEEHPNSIWTPGFTVLAKDKFTIASANLGSTPSDRHYQGCHISFADGHVEFWKWYAEKSGTPSFRLSTAPAREMNDVRRLQQVMPKP